MRSYVCTPGKFFTIVRAAPRALRCPKRDRADCGMEHRSAATTRANDFEVPAGRLPQLETRIARRGRRKRPKLTFLYFLYRCFAFFLSDIAYFVNLFVVWSRRADAPTEANAITAQHFRSRPSSVSHPAGPAHKSATAPGEVLARGRNRSIHPRFLESGNKYRTTHH